MPGKLRWFYGNWGFVLVLFLAAAIAASVPGRPAVADGGYTLPPSTQLRAVAYGNGVYVVAGAYSTSAVPGAYGSVILTSTDGIGWTVQPSLDNSSFSDIAFGNGIFVAVGRASGKPLDIGVVQTSSDGVRWRVQNFDVDLSRVVYGNGRFVLLGNNNNYVSTDGVNWTPFPNKVIVESSQLIYGNGVFADFHVTKFASSQDGVNWQTQDDGLIDYSSTGKFFPNIGVTGAVYDDGMYVAVGDYFTNTPDTPPEGNPVVITSRDAVMWTMTSLNKLCHLESIAFGNGVLVATGDDGGILTSSDGLNWTKQSTGATAYGTVSFCNDKFIALGDGTISISPDGLNWTNSGSSYQAVFKVSQANYILNGQTYPTDAAPFMEDGRVFVPVRYLGDALGVDVGWSPDSKTVGLTKNTPRAVVFGVELVVGSKTITYWGSGLPQQGASIAMDVAPQVRIGRTYLPASYVADAFGFTAIWDPADQTVTLEPENTPDQTLLSNLPALIQSLSIADDSPCSEWWTPQDQQDQNNVISQALTWLKTATPYTEEIPPSAKVDVYANIGPSQLCLTTSNKQDITIYPAYYCTTQPTETNVEVNGMPQEQPSYLYQVHYVQDVVAYDNGQGISYFKSEPFFDWLKTDQWKTEFEPYTTYNH